MDRGRPTTEDCEQLVEAEQLAALELQVRQPEDLVKQISKDDAGRLTAREIVFARLVGAEGYNHKEAYIESFRPSPTAKEESIHQMASRIAHRPRVENDETNIP